jgi:NADH-quinone oxidoreductase subunit C
LADETVPDETTDEAAPEAEAAPAEGAAAPAEAEAEPEPNPLHEELTARITAALGDAVIESTTAFNDVVVRVRADAWLRVAEVSRNELECDYLSFISGIDWAPAPREGGEEASGDTSSPVQPTEMTFGAAGSAGRFQVFAHVQSTSRHWGVTFKADVDEQAPTVASWVAVYPGADWHERECWEMYGFVFEGHPGLRHLYLPSEFEGHPLRKDFPLLARVVKPWPGLVDVEPMPGEPDAAGGESVGAEATDAEATDAAAKDAS